MAKKNLNRRAFLRHSLAALSLSAGYMSGCALNIAPPDPDENRNKVVKKQILACADIHIGFNNINVDSVIFKNALGDIKNNIGTIDYALVLGDMVETGSTEEFQKYLSIRNTSGISQWFELAGNHEQGGILEYEKLINYHKTYAVRDGNLVWIFLSDELYSSYGEMGEKTYLWLKDTITKHQDKNIILCTHQLVKDTVRPLSDSHSYFDPTGKYIINGSTGILDTLRVDLWLNGHQHYFVYDPELDIATKTLPKGKTTFINVASLNFNYNTQASQSFIFEIIKGKSEIVAKRRIHDLEIYDSNCTISIPLPFPVEFSTPYREICPT